MKAIFTAAILATLPIRPNHILTPGATLPVTREQVCIKGYASHVRNVSSNTHKMVFARYHIPNVAGRFEVDHLISLELGGSNDIKNLWPQAYNTKPWNAHIKDQLENHLHALVCSGAMTLKTAQVSIARDWIAAYQRLNMKRSVYYRKW